MKKPIRILLLEDMPTDAELVQDALNDSKLSYSSIIVDTEKDFVRSLRDFKPDIVLSDYHLPKYSGMMALQLVREFYPLMPVIMVTGPLNEEIAVECMREGAADYILKDNLTRLVPSILASLEKKRMAEQKIKAEADLVMALEKAQESDRLKSAFLATVSHELRTPLNAILGFSELIDDSLSSPEIIEYVENIYNSGNNLLNIIDDILNITLIESEETQINKKVFPLETMLTGLAETVFEELNARNKNHLKVVCSLSNKHNDLLVESDEHKVKEILLILIKNAIKFTHEGRIEYGYYTEENNNLVFYVKDTGIGIPKEKQEIIFDRFRQVDDTNTRQHNGLGIGLYIASKLVGLLNGKIWVESEEGKGSIFCFSLPGKKRSAQKDTAISKKNWQNIKFSGKTVLIAEDEKFNFEFLKTVVQKANAKIIWAENGVKAVAICKENNEVDLILMDIKMPEMDGITATSEIRKIRPDIPIIAQSAYSMPKEKMRASKVGINDFITKPINFQELIVTMSKYLGSNKVNN